MRFKTQGSCQPAGTIRVSAPIPAAPVPIDAWAESPPPSRPLSRPLTHAASGRRHPPSRSLLIHVYIIAASDSCCCHLQRERERGSPPWMAPRGRASHFLLPPAGPTQFCCSRLPIIVYQFFFLSFISSSSCNFLSPVSSPPTAI